MDSIIVKTTQSLTTAEDMRNQTKLIMQPYANWEKYLTPAPLSIAILGELVFISSTTDFSINKNTPKDGYKFIKYPESFRACLMQVCNSGWWAFNEAHKSMDQIRLHTAQVPDYMKTAVKILFQGDDEVVKAHLPDQLDNIRVIADECLKLSNATEERFNNVIDIIQELLEACLNQNQFYGEEIEATKRNLVETKLREQSAKETKRRTEKAMSTMEKEMEKAHENYQNALDSLPVGWEMIEMEIAEGMLQSVTGLFSGMMSVLSNPVTAVCSATTQIFATAQELMGKRGDLVDEINIYSKSSEILKLAETVKEEMCVTNKDDEIKWTNLYDQKKKKATNIKFIKQQFKRLSNCLEQLTDCSVKSEAQSLCIKGISICKQLANYAQDGNCDKDKSNEIIENVLKLITSARMFDTKSKDITKAPAMSPKPPMIFQEENKSSMQGATENARFAIEQTRAQLNRTRETYENYVENLEQNQKELTEILITMRNCELKEIDFKTTIEMLVKGMDAMGRVKEQWEKMVRFFQMVSNIVKTSLSTTLTNFVSTSEKTQALSYNAKLFSKDLLYTQAFQACNIVSLVHMISGTYTDVSNMYLMDRVSSLGKLMVMDKSKPEFEHERHQLQIGCDEAQKGILRLVLKNKEEFDRKSTARLEKIDRELLAILPAAPPEQIKSIQEVVQAGFTKEAAASYY
ncbi:uncharacterized protein [Sinocyclocheilus grahami]|uniref:uncharacterized protein n=1 Tax=Sinocyclocheilus grahami TaxID=75366 RepID=UPI0007ACB9C5|nr:PREDICTED: uncharacterized protein LOC107574212 [Sinocyclocheilus grahami]